MTKGRRVPHSSEHTAPEAVSSEHNQVLRWFQEWPMIESLIYLLHPSVERTTIAPFEQAIHYFREQLGTSSKATSSNSKSPSRLQSDDAAMVQRLAGVLYWLQQWPDIEKMLYRLKPDLSQEVVLAFRDMTRFLGNELEAAVEVERLRKEATFKPPTA